ncbi:delta(14)-sterol reductase isoform X1 [Eurytemora carolleeae]|uniref:delta(14)-sterol reductase isoform X1 n=1 Tax=Eurytemora carolleeae TaxID=1294199 RepID=UPI000C779259|nr:delta(14)-sterol reductase isoform X1 [Eurytemora carolleeae]|eukprot:XP_023339913.1 delta(14)-sterol reductase-like isoform X1 [Eurytemora affinis]
MPRRSTRSRSRGRAEPVASPKTPKTPKSTKKAVPAKPEMQFKDGDEVMARWPGSSLFFKAKISFVREDDDEYDVEYENGTVYTIKAKDVYKQQSVILKKASRGRSKSRGRSPARVKVTKKVASPDQTDSAQPEEKEEKEEKEQAKVEKVEKSKVERGLKAETPTRASARIAAKAISEGFSDDETEKIKLAPNPELPDARGKKKGWSFEWVWALLFMLMGPAILVSLHTLCQSGCKIGVPALSTDYKTYLDRDSFILLFSFNLLLDVLSFVPIGAIVNGRRMNGFLTLMSLLAVVPVLVHYKVPLGIVKKKYFTLMTSSIILSTLSSIVAYIMSRWSAKSNLNPKGNTGNPLVDLFNGREMNPRFFGLDLKLQTLRFSMIALAVLNVVLVTDNIVSSGFKVSPTLILAASFQIMYALDAMFFEEYFFQSHDAMNSGLGLSLISSYSFFPFLPTLTTTYLVNNVVVLPWYYLVAIGLMNALGYVIFRSSETQRCEFAKNPNNPKLAHLETLTTAGNKKLVVSGWWGLVRHPNYLGEILISWSWVLPAVGSLGLNALVPYYLPVMTTLMLVVRTHQINQRNKRKYGAAWNSYSEKVKSNIIPLVY